MRVLGAFGVDLGPARSMLSPDPVDNAAGYQEQQPVLELNDELLRALGGHASEPPTPAPGWESQAEVAVFLPRAERLVNELYGAGVWAFKDPRASMLLPFWLQVVPGLRVIVCIRNPLEVARSMDRRGGPYAIEHWLSAWQLHTRAALSASERIPRELVIYEDLLADPRATARRVGAFALGHEPDELAVAAAAALPSSIDRRSSITDQELTADPRVPPEIAHEYFDLREQARSAHGESQEISVR